MASHAEQLDWSKPVRMTEAEYLALRIDSLREYVLVETNQAFVQTLFREDSGQWVFSAFAGMDPTLRLRSVGIDVPLAEIYRDVPLPAPRPEPAPVLDPTGVVEPE